MAVHFFETPSIVPELEPANTGNAAQLHALEGSLETRSFLLDETIHVIDLWTYPRQALGEITVTSSLRSFDLDGAELEAWRLLGSSQFIDRRTDGHYTQTDVQPETAKGRTNVSWFRIPEKVGVTALFAAPHSMPREMMPRELSPEFAAHINRAARRSGHLAVVA